MHITMKVGEDAELRKEIMNVVKDVARGLVREDLLETMRAEALRKVAAWSEYNLQKVVLDSLDRAEVTFLTHGGPVRWRGYLMTLAVERVNAWAAGLGEEAINRAIGLKVKEAVANEVRFRLDDLVHQTIAKRVEDYAGRAVKEALKRALGGEP